MGDLFFNVVPKKNLFEEILMNYLDKKKIFNNNIIPHVLITSRENSKRNLYLRSVGYGEYYWDGRR